MSVQKALEPDNVNFPENLTMQVKNIENKLIFQFKSQKNTRALISTIDEVLEHIQVVLKVIK